MIATVINADKREFKLFAVRVFVTDWERALRFYIDTLGIPATFRNDEFGWIQLATGATNSGGFLALARVSPNDQSRLNLVGRFVGVSLETPNIFATHDRLVKLGVEFDSPPQEQEWGGVLAQMKDPDGNIITLLGSTTE